MFHLSPLATEFEPVLSAEEAGELEECEMMNACLAELELAEERELASRALTAVVSAPHTNVLLNEADPHLQLKTHAACEARRFHEKSSLKQAHGGQTFKHILHQNKSYGRRKI